MSFSKFKKIKHNTGEEIFEVKIKDGFGKFLENWVFMKGDFNKFVNIIRKKYGIEKRKFFNSSDDFSWAR